MDDLSREAIDGLAAAVRSLLPAAVDPVLQSVVRAVPLRITRTGLGGFVGLSQDPQGSILGRRLDATVEVTAKSDSADGLDGAVGTIARALLAADRPTLAQKGLLGITLQEIGLVSTSKIGNRTISQQDVSFKILYEFLKQPEEAEEIIQEIPIDLELGS